MWKPRTLAAWQKAWDEGRLVHDAVDKNLAYGGKRIGKITLIERPYLESLWDMTDAELIREGGMCESVYEFVQKYFNDNRYQKVAVVRFKFEPMEASQCLP